MIRTFQGLSILETVFVKTSLRRNLYIFRDSSSDLEFKWTDVDLFDQLTQSSKNGYFYPFILDLYFKMEDLNDLQFFYHRCFFDNESIHKLFNIDHHYKVPHSRFILKERLTTFFNMLVNQRNLFIVWLGLSV